MILLAAAVLISPPGMIDDSDARRIHGFDPSPDCAEWTEARRRNGPRAGALEAWVSGVLAGYNLYHPNGHRDILRGTDLAGAYAWIDNRCLADPDEALPDITIDLIAEFQIRTR
ncbi:MAG: hypothetical protein H7X93_08080 [Sphingomonadaceae bacterium]|nr:hypothetical protein [Sphingomonadaceae bacterium]